MSAVIFGAGFIATLLGAAFVLSLLAPVRLGGRLALLLVALYCAAVEIDVEPLAGATVDRLADLALGGLAVGGLVLLMLERPSLRVIFRKPIVWLIGLLCAGLVLAPISLSPVPTAQRSIVAIAVVVSVVLLVQRCGFIHVLAAVVFGALVLVVVSIGWEVVGPGTPPNELSNVIDSGFAGLERHQGITAQPNQFGRVAASLVIGGVVLALRRSSYVMLGIIAQIAGIVGLYFAQSRTAIVATAVVLLIAYARAGRLFVVSGLVVIGLSAGLWLSSTGAVGVETVTRAEGGGTEELTTATGRTSLWRITIELAREHPITGTGAFATDRALAPAVEDGRIAFDATDAHNIVLNTFLAQGAIGVVLLIALAVSAAKQIVGGTAIFGCGLLLALIAGLAMTENLFWKPNSTLALLAVALVGVGIGERSAVRSELDRTMLVGVRD